MGGGGGVRGGRETDSIVMRWGEMRGSRGGGCFLIPRTSRTSDVFERGVEMRRSVLVRDGGRRGEGSGEVRGRWLCGGVEGERREDQKASGVPEASMKLDGRRRCQGSRMVLSLRGEVEEVR